MELLYCADNKKTKCWYKDRYAEVQTAGVSGSQVKAT